MVQVWIGAGIESQEYGGCDLSRVLRNSKRISNWGEAHVRSIMYQLMCGLLYLQVALSFAHDSEWEHRSSRPEAVQNSHQ